MPSIDAPFHYERADHIASSRADDFLKWLDDDEFEDTTGTVESPLGWVGLINIKRQTIRTWVSSQGDPWMSERRNFAPGWYVVRIDDNGLVWGLCYGEDCVYNEERARADFAEAEQVAAAWSYADDGLDYDPDSEEY
jgi:hypothetical protein